MATANDAGLLRIGEAAGLIGVHVRTLRRWEAAGRLVPVRTTGGHRRYRRAEVLRAAGLEDDVEPAPAPAAPLRPARVPPAPLPALAAVVERRPELLVRRLSAGLYAAASGGWFRRPHAQALVLELLADVATAARAADWLGATRAVARFAESANADDGSGGPAYDEWFQFLRLLRATVGAELVAVDAAVATDAALLFALLERESAVHAPRFVGGAAGGAALALRDEDAPPSPTALDAVRQAADALAAASGVVTAVVLSGTAAAHQLTVRAVAGAGGPPGPHVTLVDGELASFLVDESSPLVLPPVAAETFGLLGPAAPSGARCLPVAATRHPEVGGRLVVVVLGVASGVVVTARELELVAGVAACAAEVLHDARSAPALDRAARALAERWDLPAPGAPAGPA